MLLEEEMREIKLERGRAEAFAPAPSAVRAGDYVYTSSIYPLDERGHAVLPDPLAGEIGPSAVEVQARHCFERLKAVLGEFGGHWLACSKSRSTS